MLRVLYLDIKLPRPDRDSASLRSAQFLQYLSAHSEVDLAVISDYGLGADADRQAAALGARLASAAGVEAIRAHIRRHGPAYNVVVFAWSRTASAFMADVRNAAPRAFLVYDTVDVNHVREFRHARVTGNARRLQTALRVRAEETAAIAMADTAIAITDVDRAVLQALVPGACIAIIGQWVEPALDAPTPGETPIVLFIGHYQAAPNHDAAIILAREVLPLVQARVPNACLVLAGSDPGPGVTELAGPASLVPGWEPDLRPRLVSARVFAAPLRFGSGLKGKILQAIAHRVPLVATAVAVEGTGLVPGRDYLAAETPAECAEGIIRILTEPAMGTRLAENAIQVVRERFSRNLVWHQFDAVFGPLLRDRG